jgi:hypothetical protein
MIERQMLISALLVTLDILVSEGETKTMGIVVDQQKVSVLLNPYLDSGTHVMTLQKEGECFQVELGSDYEAAVLERLEQQPGKKAVRVEG